MSSHFKSAEALKFSIDRLGDTGVLYFWTFTFKELHALPDACIRWQRACRDLVARTGFTGIRVYELHEEHGLHIHAVVSGRYNIRLVRHIVTQYGFGRTHVKRVRTNPYYIAKYVGKSERAPCLTSRRLWAVFGCKDIKTRKHCFHTRTRDITIDSIRTRAIAWVKSRLALKGLQLLSAGAMVESLAIESGDDLRGDCKVFEGYWSTKWAGVGVGSWKRKREIELAAMIRSELSGSNTRSATPSPSGAFEPLGSPNLVKYQTTPDHLKFFESAA